MVPLNPALHKLYPRTTGNAHNPVACCCQTSKACFRRGRLTGISRKIAADNQGNAQTDSVVQERQLAAWHGISFGFQILNKRNLIQKYSMVVTRLFGTYSNDAPHLRPRNPEMMTHDQRTRLHFGELRP